jgi:hypothetical protein
MCTCHPSLWRARALATVMVGLIRTVWTVSPFFEAWTVNAVIGPRTRRGGGFTPTAESLQRRNPPYPWSPVRGFTSAADEAARSRQEQVLPGIVEVATGKLIRRWCPMTRKITLAAIRFFCFPLPLWHSIAGPQRSNGLVPPTSGRSVGRCWIKAILLCWLVSSNTVISSAHPARKC